MIMIEEKRALMRKEVKPKYSKDSDVNEQVRGRFRKGIKRYNTLIKVVPSGRNTTQIKYMEMKKICGKIGRRSGGEESSDSDDSNGEIV